MTSVSETHRRWRGRRARPADARTVVFPTDTLELARPHAARRGITPNELLRRIIDHVLDEGMVDAVLDDAHVVPSANQPREA